MRHVHAAIFRLGLTPPGLDCALLSPRRIAMTLSMHQASVPVSNLCFHCTIVYAILRQSGAQLGETDFIGKPA
ncbi:MAG: DUF1993 family protein [Thermomonas sp.]